MYNNLTPDYLSSLVPSSVNEGSRYNLRNANDVQTINARTALYFNSFLPSVIREWNTLSENDKYVDSVDSFKRQISRNKTAVPKYFFTGSRKLQILHTRLRTGCSSLNHDLFVKSISDTPLCSCRSGDVENAEHFFLPCNFYRDHRIELFRIVFNIVMRLYMYFYMVMSYFLMKQIKSFLKLSTSTYRTAKDFKYLPVGDSSII